MAEVALESKLGWELGKTVARVHFKPVISSATGVGGLEGAVVDRAVESDELVETVSEAAEGAAGAVDHSMRPTSFAAVIFSLAHDLLGDFNYPVENVGNSPSQLTGGVVFGAGRNMNVRLDRDGKPEGEKDQ